MPNANALCKNKKNKNFFKVEFLSESFYIETFYNIFLQYYKKNILILPNSVSCVRLQVTPLHELLNNLFENYIF